MSEVTLEADIRGHDKGDANDPKRIWRNSSLDPLISADEDRRQDVDTTRRYGDPLRQTPHSSPPSTGMSAPVMKSDAELARKAAMPAKASGVPTRPAAVRLMTPARNAGSPCMPFVMAVSINPVRRAVANALSGEWHARLGELAGNAAAKARFAAAGAKGDMAYRTVWAGEALDMVHAVEPAGDVVGRLVVEAEAALARRSALFTLDERA